MLAIVITIGNSMAMKTFRPMTKCWHVCEIDNILEYYVVP